SFGSIHQVLLIRALDFKAQAQINFLSTVISGCIGLLMAALGFRYWALVIQTVSGIILINSTGTVFKPVSILSLIVSALGCASGVACIIFNYTIYFLFSL
ncbi:MAG: oligosaccharide flippase family protein, partial [Syntrophaceae bacterium]|nr:oligosaccharide flippase family protein [Syntrophaceae bacterium]